MFKNINTSFYEELLKRFLQNFSKELDELHLRLGGKGTMSMEVKKEIVTNMINDDAKMGIEYSLKHKVKTIFKVLDKYQKNKTKD